MNLNDVKYIIIHCSASDMTKDDSIGAIRALHMADPTVEFSWGKYLTHGKGFSDVGYHYFIDSNGKCFDGRKLDVAGAHTRNWNKQSIGICLSGDKFFYPEQFKTLSRVIKNLRDVLPNLIKIVGHSYFNINKTCPNFDLYKNLNCL